MARQPQCYTVPMSLQIHSPAAVKNYVERSLEDIERIYVAARVEGSMPIPAARVAGYKDAEQAAMLLEDDHRIRTAIEATFRLKIHETQIKKADVINGMKDAIMQAESAGEQISGWREIAKLLYMYDKDYEESKPDEEPISEKTDEELAAALDGDFEVLDFDDVTPGKNSK